MLGLPYYYLLSSSTIFSYVAKASPDRRIRSPRKSQKKNIIATAWIRFIMQIRRRRSNYPWQGWTTSLLIFCIILLLAQSPPHESNVNLASISNNERKSTSTQIHQHDNKLTAGDVIVKCILTTPHAQKNATYQPVEGTIEIYVHQDLAPYAANAFLFMVTSKHFDGNYLFRVVPGFVVQWGIESPRIDGKAQTKFPKVEIDPPPSKYDRRRSNVRGALNFAGGNSGTGQVYINTGDNPHLDKEEGSLPFASLGEESMKIIDSVYDGYIQGSGQVKAVNENEVERLFPNMSRIEKCWLSSAVER